MPLGVGVGLDDSDSEPELPRLDIRSYHSLSSSSEEEDRESGGVVIRLRGEDEDLVDDVRLVDDEYVIVRLLSSSGIPSQPETSA